MGSSKNIIKVITIFLVLISVTGYGQVNEIYEDKARNELKKRHISEDEVKRRLLIRGLDPENITPDQVPVYEAAVQDIIAEIEAEKARVSTTDTVEAKGGASDVEEKKISSEIPKEQGRENIIQNDSSVTIEKSPEKSLTSHIYGHHLFQNAEISLYRSSDEVTIPKSYVLTTGDEVRISIFGASQADFVSTINQEGYISPVKPEKIYLKGLTMQQATELVKKRFMRRFKFSGDQISFTLATARNITLNIFGEVHQSGSYSISAINTGINALVAAGGPSPKGSVRNIKLIKGNGKTKVLDLYQYLSDPKVQFNYPIDDQDIIFVPLAENIVEINGAINRPMYYEMKEGESLEDLIQYAGGLTSEAYKDLVQISRIGEEERILIDIDLTDYLDTELEFEIKDGDIITIKSIPTGVKNYVAITGELTFPGEYSFSEGMTLQDLIDKAQFTDYTRKDIAFLFRTNLDNTIELSKINLTEVDLDSLLLIPRDRVKFLSIRSFVDQTKSISIAGAVRQPDTIQFNPRDKIKLSDLILLAGGLKQNANPDALITRINPSNTEEIMYLTVDLFKAISDTSSVDNVLLKEGDHVEVYYNERYHEIGEVGIIGQVRNPTSTRFDPSLNIKDLLLMAGGVKENASNIAILKRRAINNDVDVEYFKFLISDVMKGKSDIELQRGDVIQIYDENLYLNQFNVQILGEVKNPGSYDYDESITIGDLIYMSGGVTLKASMNNIQIYRVDMESNESTRILLKEVEVERSGTFEYKAKEKITLEPYDIIIVRPVENFELQELVEVRGEVKFPGPYILTEKDNSLKDIVNRAGGISKEGLAEGATLIRKNALRNGLIIINLKDALTSGNSHEDIVLLAGDMIFVPKREDVVSIRAYGTGASSILADSLLEEGNIQIAYQGKKSAKWYINNYSGGFQEDTDKNTVRVIEQNGRIKSTKTFLGIFRCYPKVTKGSLVRVDVKPPKVEEKQKESEPINWTRVITDSFALLTSAVTIIVLVSKL